MKRNLLYIALLLIAAQGAWAWETNYYPKLLSPTPSEGPWTYDAFNSTVTDDGDNYRSFNSLTHEAWKAWDGDGTMQRQNDYGLGFFFHCDEARYTYYIMYHTYYHNETLPPYTRRQLTWDYEIYGSYSLKWCDALFAHEDMDALKNMWTYVTVDKDGFSGDYRAVYNIHTNPYCIIYYKGQGQSSTVDRTGTKVFDFDNRHGSETAIKSWNLMMTFVVYDSDVEDEATGRSSFKSRKAKWDTFYYKHLTFDTNGGIGTMPQQEIENSDNLTANAFTRAGYAFQGWATTPNGSVVYADGQAIEATAEDKGPVTLYAVWKPTVASVMAAIDAIGNVVYTAECKAHIDDVRALYNMLSAEDKSAVTNYNTLIAAESTYLTIQNVVNQINALNPVTAASGDAIAAARATYNELTEAQKPLVINYSALVDAEAQYAILPVVTAIDTIGTVTAESGTAIAAARTAYDALSNTRKSLVTNYATLLAAEAAFADLGKTTVLYVDQAGTDTIHTQRKSIAYPAFPEGATQWQTVYKSAKDSIIVIKAVE